MFKVLILMLTNLRIFLELSLTSERKLGVMVLYFQAELCLRKLYWAVLSLKVEGGKELRFFHSRVRFYYYERVQPQVHSVVSLFSKDGY